MKVTQETAVVLYGETYYVYQDADSKVIWPAIDFINHIIKAKSSPSTIATYRQAIRSLFDFLAKKGKTWDNMTDNLLVDYRSWQLERSVKDPRWRGNINVTKNSINHDYIFPLYEFYFWALRQELHPMLLGVQPNDGAQFQITSALPLRDKTASKKDGPGQKKLYPKVFTDCGVSDVLSDKVVEDWELDQLNDYIRTNYDGYERASMLLMVRISDGNGSRPIALSGYVRLQFTQTIIERELFNTDKDSIKVTPLAQKGGNTMPINFSLKLITRIISFIQSDLQSFLDETGFEQHNGHLFLNPKNGTPITPQHISKIFSAITNKLGWPQGKSIYGLRHRFANRRMALQADINAELGFSSEENAVAMQVADDMTHRNKQTLIKHYLRDRMRHGHKTRHYIQDARIKELEADREQQTLETQMALETAENERQLANQARNKTTHERQRADKLEQELKKVRQVLAILNSSK
ncbi:site-specific integrase [Colwellia hornerae]|uniref:Site-specific integrase n=1 Tax=Colwellia hornerae TaxID=89402 RepID=A0A5C6Q8S1_9GAMM|nr:site-specific integrase [Colwellia hornerae]TWX53056.1 hypothetical protein ESZ28_10770 [Colwellia hornerae]TWX59319.1 hypothetical protein ESZ26_10150 [Colwellia hornerae]TWX65444.1 hypothetical protein ESZ27_12240 [Colwellia hornerae]